jgi:hypothetical protein
MSPHVLLPVVYELLVVAALGWMFLHATETAFAGLFALVLTLPWSVPTVFIVNVLRPSIFEWSLIPATVLVSGCAGLNGILLFFLVRRVAKAH